MRLLLEPEGHQTAQLFHAIRNGDRAHYGDSKTNLWQHFSPKESCTLDRADLACTKVSCVQIGGLFEMMGVFSTLSFSAIVL